MIHLSDRVLRSLLAGAMAFVLCAPLLRAQTPASENPHASAAAATEPAAATAMPDSIRLQPGEMRSIPVAAGVTRIAVADPAIADVRVLSSQELLVQGKDPGTTSLMIWGANGQYTTRIEVVDEALVAKIRRLLDDMQLQAVEIKREDGQIFLFGQVGSQDDLGRLNDMLGAFGGKITTNLVSVAPEAAPPPEPVQSIALTVQLIEMSRDATKELGVDWANSLSFTESTFAAPTLADKSLSERVSDAFRIGSFSRTGLNPELRMLISNGKARILAEPKLVAGSGKEATATLGVEVPVITSSSVSSGVVTQSVEFKKTGVELTFKPTILPEGDKLQLVVEAKVSSIDNSNFVEVSGTKVPSFRTRETKTEIFPELGQAVVIAGLLQEEESTSLSQVPGIGSVPVLGNLFKSTDYSRNLTELVIIVTPELVGGQLEAADRSLELERALSSAELSGSVQDPTLRYVLQVQERISKALRYPGKEKELGMGGRVKLRLHLFRDGTLGQSVIAESSGIQALDTEALKAAEQSAPYPPFSSELPQQDLWLEVPVIFRP